MTAFGDPAFFDRYAHEYDERTDLDPTPAVDFLAEFDRGQRVATQALTEDSVRMEFLRHSPVDQTVTYQRVTIDERGFTLRPLRLRYCWPSELDLMARLAGLTLRDRYTDWDRSPFTAESRRHVSVYERV